MKMQNRLKRSLAIFPAVARSGSAWPVGATVRSMVILPEQRRQVARSKINGENGKWTNHNRNLVATVAYYKY